MHMLWEVPWSPLQHCLGYSVLLCTQAYMQRIQGTNEPICTIRISLTRRSQGRDLQYFPQEMMVTRHRYYNRRIMCNIINQMCKIRHSHARTIKMAARRMFVIENRSWSAVPMLCCINVRTCSSIGWTVVSHNGI